MVDELILLANIMVADPPHLPFPEHVHIRRGASCRVLQLVTFQFYYFAHALMRGFPMVDANSTSSFVWHAIKNAAKSFGVGVAAQKIVPKLAPTVRPGAFFEVLEPMGPLATRLVPLRPLIKTVGRVATEVGPLAPLTILATNPTNRFPGSQAEQEMTRRYLEAEQRRRGVEEQHRLEEMSRRNKEMLSSIETQRRQAIERDMESQRRQAIRRELNNQKRNALQLKLSVSPPFPMNRTGSVFQPRLEPVKLRPPTKIQTPFNLRLLRPPPTASTNPFGLNIMGRPPGTPFGLTLGTPRLRAPMIGR
jgi:hypothetical protein